MDNASFTMICKNDSQIILEIIKKIIDSNLEIELLFINSLGSNVSVSGNVKVFNNISNPLTEITRGHQIIRESFAEDNNFKNTKMTYLKESYPKLINYIKDLLVNEILISKLELKSRNNNCSLLLEVKHKDNLNLTLKS